MVTRRVLGAFGCSLALSACGASPTSTPPTDVSVTDVSDTAALDATLSDADPADAAVPNDATVSEAATDAAQPLDTPADVVSDRGPSALACRSDEACTAPATCDRTAQLYVRGLCSRPCSNPRAPPAAQTAACGIPESTCLAVGFFGGRCLRACDATAPGSCLRGQACSALWFDPPGSPADETACVRFCDDDSDCVGDPGGPRCRQRLGVCDRSADNPSLLPDGSPCNPVGVAECRGFCLEAVDVVATHGVCASLVRRGARCPDDPSRVAVQTSRTPDEIGMCVWRACARDCECPTGLVCIHEKDAMGRPTTGARTCRYPTMTQPVGVPCA